MRQGDPEIIEAPTLIGDGALLRCNERDAQYLILVPLSKGNMEMDPTLFNRIIDLLCRTGFTAVTSDEKHFRSPVDGERYVYPYQKYVARCEIDLPTIDDEASKKIRIRAESPLVLDDLPAGVEFSGAISSPVGLLGGKPSIEIDFTTEYMNGENEEYQLRFCANGHNSFILFPRERVPMQTTSLTAPEVTRMLLQIFPDIDRLGNLSNGKTCIPYQVCEDFLNTLRSQRTPGQDNYAYKDVERLMKANADGYLYIPDTFMRTHYREGGSDTFFAVEYPASEFSEDVEDVTGKERRMERIKKIAFTHDIEVSDINLFYIDNIIYSTYLTRGSGIILKANDKGEYIHQKVSLPTKAFDRVALFLLHNQNLAKEAIEAYVEMEKITKGKCESYPPTLSMVIMDGINAMYRPQNIYVFQVDTSNPEQVRAANKAYNLIYKLAERLVGILNHGVIPIESVAVGNDDSTMEVMRERTALIKVLA